MAGVVLRIVAQDGARVTAGGELIVLESMKMEIPILAPQDGTVSVAVREGQFVQEGALLVELR